MPTRKGLATKNSNKRATKRPGQTAASAQSQGSSKSGSPTKKPLITRQPQSKQQAAVQSGMFLYTDDAWSLRYFNQGDLRYEEREIFG
jgi:hypothetical protein